MEIPLRLSEHFGIENMSWLRKIIIDLPVISRLPSADDEWITCMHGAQDNDEDDFAIL